MISAPYFWLCAIGQCEVLALDWFANTVIDDAAVDVDRNGTN
jgi:hypothetical protein